jgi:hypothetical protein
MVNVKSLGKIVFAAVIALMVLPGYSAMGMEIQKSSSIILPQKETSDSNQQVIKKMNFAVLSYSDHKINYFEVDCPEELQRLLEPYQYTGYMLFQLIGETTNP